MNTNNKILVTGHKGNIGSKLFKALQSLELGVTGIDLKEGRDCSDISTLEKLGHFDTIFHLAANLHGDPKTMRASEAILEYAKKYGSKVIYASSAAVYNPFTEYAVHKLHGEVLFTNNLSNSACLRLFNVYGGNSGIGLIDKIIRKEEIEVHGDGNQCRDYVHIDDVVDAFITAFETNFVGIADIGTGNSYSVNEVLDMFHCKNYTMIIKDGGVRVSKAMSNRMFPWHPQQSIRAYANNNS